MNPGNYGGATFQDSAFGTPTKWIVFRANPATVTPRPSGWFESPGAVTKGSPGSVPRPSITADSDKFPIFSTIRFLANSSQNRGRYVEIDGLYLLDGNFNFDGQSGDGEVSHIRIRNSNVFGNYDATPYSDSTTLHSIYIHPGGFYRDLLIEDNYFEKCQKGFQMEGKRGANIIFRHNHVYHTSRTMVALGTQSYDTTPGTNLTFLIEDNHFEHQFSKPQSASNSKVSHGSGISGRSGYYTLRNNVFHGLGSTRGIYHYHDVGDGASGGPGFKNVTIENNLFYDIINSAVFDIKHMSGPLVVRNNTLVGRYNPAEGRSDSSNLYFGICFRTGNQSGSGYFGAQLVFADNVCVGTFETGPGLGTRSGNVVYVDYFGGLDPATNTIVKPGGGDLRAFFTAPGNFFVGIPGWTFNVAHHQDFTQGFRVIPSRPPVGYQFDIPEDATTPTAPSVLRILP